ncbi:hypothetical protein BSZ21_23890 [Bradyrhizobium canariense]|uniref:avidin/streptavidin family protein n=1 Tax=Bradyrhizobium canariense TaxID=255045 RepID=UPI000A199856|nr:hypothetical protein BSZ21_23890 [Bradyrhizobium canariense]
MMRFFTLLLCAIIWRPVHAHLPGASSWVNQSGSVLSVQTLDPSTGDFTGKYVDKAAGFSSQGHPYPVAGNIKANKIAFYINWNSPTAPTCRTVTIWHGRVAGGTIPTRWTRYYLGADWRIHLRVGRDLFRRRWKQFRYDAPSTYLLQRASDP